MRDTLKNKEYYNEYIIETKLLIEDNDKYLKEGKIKEELIKWNRKSNFDYSLNILIAKYSSGENLETIRSFYFKTLEVLLLSWNENVTKIKSKNQGNEVVLWNQYMVSPHFQMLQMLSLAYLLDIPDITFENLINIIDKDNVSDNLYEFIIKARFPERKQKRSEEYDKKQSVILKVYDKLRKATEQTNKSKASILVKQFLEKDFYHKHADFYNSHKKKYNAYYGYWSFEAAVVVKIMELDDSSFIDNQYYPKDLVHIPIEEPKTKGFLGKLGF